MIECIFTLDYEIYGNGEGSLKELIYEPAERLMTIFRQHGVRFVPFIEVAELEMIENQGSDPAIDLVKNQIRDFHRDGFEVGLHLHPQWYNGRYVNGKWVLDNAEYNLCTLPRDRITDIVNRAIGYLRCVLGVPDFNPISFRAGNWLLQPTETISYVLSIRGIKVDSSLFKGGVRHSHSLDYRPALKNGYYWFFGNDVNVGTPGGYLLEAPIYTEMVPFWKIMNRKRISMEANAATRQDIKSRMNRVRDLLRFLHPMKLDFCRMTSGGIASVMNKIIKEDEADPNSLRPIVFIGHTKELTDLETVDSVLSFLARKKIGVSTFDSVYRACTAHNIGANK